MDLHTLINSAKFISAIGIGLALFFLIPIGTGIVYGENMAPFIRFDLLFFLFNLVLFAALYRRRMRMTVKSAIFSVNLVWILLGIAGAVPLYIYTEATFTESFFEAISGFTTTGATIYTEIEHLPKSILMLRSLMHWLGGMGIIVLGVGLLSLINPTGSMTMFRAESTGVQLEKATPKIRDTALRLWGLYLFFTAANTVLLLAGGMNLFDAVNHAFSTISTGGFSTRDLSMGYWDDAPVILWTTTFFMMLSGINFLAHLKAARGDFSGFRAEEVRWYLGLFILLASVLTLVHLANSGDSIVYSTTHAFFTVASLLTTTGFATINYELWGAVPVALLLIAMLLGGNAGSTAGGMKIIRYVILFKNLKSQLKQILHPNAVVGVFVDRKPVSSKVIGSVSGFLFLFITTNVLLTFYLFARGYDAVTCISTSIACVGNIGPGFAMTGPSENFHFFSGIDKMILSAAMIIGRLEFFTVVLLFTRDFWKRY
ncbi:TrkH family potassium uptake protein [Sulfurimonas sp. HSL-3221]|uniref:TrkH family potassium uptake protein n=1 Tax=Sulfurimonadaceae TaxID=2771471 RepID=UPI001E604128|nr:TrkH family potassium uptake protein [Sulfurimonas sp. HSL-3221]UFS61443.1 TrkH family potassium uptake protein [Sulfurimonas sp. HSL-3221]